MIHGLTEITLRKTSMTSGFPTQSITSTKTAIARVGTATRSEFYAAASAGIKADMVCLINAFEYDNEDEAVLDGTVYTIIRAYSKTPHKIELTMSRR